MRLARLLFSVPVFASAASAAPVDFSRDVRPIISEKCFACHGPDEASRKAKLRLDLRDEALKERDGVRAIIPGKPDDSELIVRITSKDPDEVMPPPKEHHEISPAEIDVFRRWIAEGAPYAKHWAFEKPQRPAVPEIKEGAQTLRTPIDRFIEAELQKKGLALSADADRHTVLRRLSLDLIGLPPAPAEVEAFVQDSRPDYYERAVDRLLASPHFGERWARMWMDCGRYADSTGYGSDKMRTFMWPWRDWVINAFNRNLPYDQFTTEQLAGDLLPNATRDQILATTLHRNTMTNIEGGTIDEEYRVAAIKDRVSTTMQVWMGLTAGCAQCHTHKFDPISQREYYSLFAIFNQTEDSDREDEEPRLSVPTPEEEKRTNELNAQIASLNEALKLTTPELEAEFQEWEAKMLRPIEWKPLAISEAKVTGDTILETLPDQSVIARSGTAEREQYTVRGSTELRQVTALRIEVLPDDSLPEHGPGRAGNGNAVLSEISASIREANPVLPHARFVRVEAPGKNRILSLAEVEVFSDANNIAQKGKASQSTVDFGGEATRAIDGNTNGNFDKKSVTHTAQSENPWWEVDLGGEYALDAVIVWNRLDGLSDRLKGARVVLLDAMRNEVAARVIENAPAPKTGRLFDVAKEVKLANASADFAQPDFGAPLAVDGNDKTGWALGGATGVAHAIVVECKAPITLEGNTELVIALSQQYGKNHTLGRFRISVTDVPAPVRELPPAIRAGLAIEPSERSADQRTELLAYFRPLSKYAGELNRKLDAAKTELAKIKPVRVPVLRELAAEKHRKTHILTKGNYLAPGEEVSAGTLKEFHSAPAGQIDRLALSKWIMDPENPLTARVAVNRFWSQLFGRGLVESEEDFGTQGTLPSHPELLDWLAVEFRENGWDMKRLLKLIVSSTTYRQSSKVTPELLQKDPIDRLLSRYPRRRLGAEEVRDQALAVSGLLSEKLGGPSVYPPQPDGLWKVAFNGASTAEYKTSTGEDRWRRGLYTVWRRTMPNPTMVTFDAPSRETCTIRRVPTNTPLQAFVTLNDPVFVECSQALARRIIKEGGTDPDARIRFALQLCLARPVEDKQVAPLRRLLDEELLHYREVPDDAAKLATQPLGPLPAGVDTAEAAAWTSVANVILNLDGFLARN
jgi:hypothetical protein